MRIITALLLAVVLSGCVENFSVPTTKIDIIPAHSVIVIDDCEYIQVVNGAVMSNSYSYAITHKGNCKNPIHKTH